MHIKPKVNIFDIFKSSLLIYKNNFIILVLISLLFTTNKFAQSYCTSPHGKIIFLFTELAIDIAFTYYIVVGKFKNFMNHTDCSGLILSRYFKLLGVALLASIIMLIAMLPSFFAFQLLHPLKKKFIYTLIFSVFPLIMNCYIYLSSTICILRDFDDNHIFYGSSISESFSIGHKHFSSILIITLLFLLPLTPGIYKIYIAFKTMDVNLIKNLINFKTYIICIFTYPIPHIVCIEFFYRVTGIKPKEYEKKIEM